MKTFLIKVVNKKNVGLYKSHGQYNKGDAGLDLYTIDDIKIEANETKLVDLGIKCQCRSFCFNPIKWLRGYFYNYHSYYMIPRSSISKTPLMMKNSIGLIDKGYSGNIKVALINMSNHQYTISSGVRLVQLVNADLSSPKFKLVSKLRNTERGEGGFGSTNQ